MAVESDVRRLVSYVAFALDRIDDELIVTDCPKCGEYLALVAGRRYSDPNRVYVRLQCGKCYYEIELYECEALKFGWDE